MPYVLVVALLDILCILHAVRSGRPLYWAFIILAFPVLGAAAYVVAEILPELIGGHGAQKLVADARETLDPERRYRKLLHEVDVADTPHNRRLLAEECLHIGRSDEAVALYESILTGLHENDHGLLLGLARACFAGGRFERCSEILARVRQQHAKHFSADVQLLYARSLEGAGRLQAALAEYHDTVQRFSGEEARCRYGLALLKAGYSEQARQMFSDILRFVDRRPKHYRRAQRQWIQIAQQNLS